MLVKALRSFDPALICMAGFMRILSPELLKEYPSRILNMHPALLPSFPGLHAQRQALQYGVKVSGCTVHLADEGVDTGPILLQRAVDVLEGDTEETLSARILEQEHQIYWRAIALVLDRMNAKSKENAIFSQNKSRFLNLGLYSPSAGWVLCRPLQSMRLRLCGLLKIKSFIFVRSKLVFDKRNN